MDKEKVVGTSKTDRFKEHLQKIIAQSIGAKVSKEKAWSLFKNFNFGTVEFCANEEDGVLSLAGVGTFKVIKTEPRGKKAGLDKDGKPIPGAKPYEFIPRMKTYHSDKVAQFLAQHYGQEDFGVEFKSVGLFAKDAEVEDTAAQATVPAKVDKAENEAPAAKPVEL